jgi:hypothetical protein
VNYTGESRTDLKNSAYQTIHVACPDPNTAAVGFNNVVHQIDDTEGRFRVIDVAASEHHIVRFGLVNLPCDKPACCQELEKCRALA